MNTKMHTRFWGFNFRVFREGVRQLKTVGILFTVVMILEALLVPIGQAISAYADRENMTRQFVTVLNMHPLLLIPMFTLAPLAVLIVFGFLNKRSSSDFYHAIPVNRSALFISLYSAVVFWILVVIISSTAVSAITCLCFPQVLQLDFSGVLPMLAGSIAGSLLVAACVAIAMCITGTLFNNVLVALMIFGVPRLLLTFVSGALQSSIAIMPVSYSNPFLNMNYNIPIGLVAFTFTGGSPTELLTHWQGALYTFIISFFYFLAAVALFRVRKSEAAGYAAATPALQHVYRLMLTFLVTLIPLYAIFDCLQTMNISSWDIFTIVALYLVAAIVFCVYELITVKKPKHLIKIIPSFAIVLAADVVLLGVLFACYRTVLSFRPTAAEITAVTLKSENGNSNYFDAKTGNVVIADKEILSIVANRLDASAKANDIEAGLTEKQKAEDLTSYTVSVRTDSVPRQRRLYFTAAQSASILKALSKNATYQTVYTLPAKSNAVSVNTNQNRLSQADTDRVYASMCREMQKLTFEQRYSMLAQGSYPQTACVFVDYSIQVSIGGEIYDFGVPLTADYFPESYDLYLSLRMENTKTSRTAVREAMKNKVNASDSGIQIECYTATGETVFTDSYMIAETDATALQQLEGLLSDSVPTHRDNFCRISYSTREETADGKMSYSETEAFFKLDDTGVELLRQIGK